MAERVPYAKIESELDPEVAERCFEAYRDGNLLYPQMLDGGGFLMAYELVKDGLADLEAFARYTLTPKQQERLKDAMNAAHAARHVAVATGERLQATADTIIKKHGEGVFEHRPPKEVREARFASLWFDFQTSALKQISEFVLPTPEEKGFIRSGRQPREVVIEAAGELDMGPARTAAEAGERSWAKTLIQQEMLEILRREFERQKTWGPVEKIETEEDRALSEFDARVRFILGDEDALEQLP